MASYSSTSAPPTGSYVSPSTGMGGTSSYGGPLNTGGRSTSPSDKLDFNQSSTLMTVFYGLSSIFLPPLAVGFKTGDPCETGINILFLFLGWIPACIHAFLISFGSGSNFRLTCYPESAMLPPPGVKLENALATKGYGGGTGSPSMTTTTTTTNRSSSYPSSNTGQTSYQSVPLQRAY